MKQILYADDLVIMGETMEELKENLDEWREAFESKGMRVNLRDKVDGEWNEGRSVRQ